MTCIKILASQMGVVSCGDGGRDSSVHILSCGACAFRVGRRMRMRCEDVGFPDQRGVVVTPSEQAFLVLEENVWREHARVHARPVLCPLAFIVEVCTWMPRVIAFSTQAHTALWCHQHRSYRTVAVRSPRTAAHSVLQTRVCINCVSTRSHPCSGSVVLTKGGAGSVCVRSAAACGRGSSSDWPLTGLRPRPTRSRRTRRPPSGTQHARPSSHTHLAECARHTHRHLAECARHTHRHLAECALCKHRHLSECVRHLRSQDFVPSSLPRSTQIAFRGRACVNTETVAG